MIARKTNPKRDRVLALREEGHSFSEIGATLGITKSSVAGIVHRANGYVRPPKATKGLQVNPQVERYMEAAKSGMTLQQAADHFGRARVTLRGVETRHGFKFARDRNRLERTPELDALRPDQRADVATLVRAGDYTQAAAIAEVTKPRIKVRVTV